MSKMNFWGVFGNSVIITVSATILTLLFSGMCAFVVTRNNWVACRLIFALMIASMVIPFQVLMIPIVSIYGGTLNVLNHRLTLILMHTGFSVEHSAGAGGGRADRRMYQMADILESRLSAARADDRNRCDHRRDGILERLPASEPDPD